jgi:hypothetical protein
MAGDNSPNPVTRREFYSTAVVLYGFIGILALLVASPGEGWFRPVVPWILAAGCILAVFLNVFAAARQKPGPSSP